MHIIRVSNRCYDAILSVKHDVLMILFRARYAAQSCYRAKLALLGGIQDPYLQQTPTSNSLVEWQHWPEVEYPDIYHYLVAIPGAYTQDQLKAYKSLDAYNFFVNGYVAYVLLPVCLVLVRT